MKNSSSIIFFGNEKLATGIRTELLTLKSLIQNGYKVSAVISNNSDSVSRNPRNLEIAEVARKNNIPLLIPDKPIEIIDDIKKYNPTIGVLVAYGKIVPQEIIDLFPLGIVNIHPSLLPKYRGPTPIETAILEGAEKTGVSIMKLVKEMDAGPIYIQRTLHIGQNESKQEIADKLLNLGKDLLIEILPRILNGELKPRSQPHPTRATYSRKISKKDGSINWTKNAEQLHREIRAFKGWPSSKTTIAGKEVIITDTSIAPDESTSLIAGSIVLSPDKKLLAVSTGKGTLYIERLKPVGKRDMSSKEFIAGYWRKV